MNCARNIVTANFSGGGTSATTAPLWQWDYGQALCVTGIEDLPAAFEVHFSTNRTGGVSTVAVGADGQVTIPNDLLTIGKNLNAWIYLSDAQGEGETEYSILIPVKARPMPETYDAEVTGEFDDVVRQVSEYAETAQTAADNAGASASAAAASADSAAASATAAEAAKTAAETAQGKAEDAQAAAETAAQTATEKAQQTAQDAAQAALDAGRAESAAQSAEAAQTGAESAKTDAETAAQGAAASASAASASSTSAGQAASAAARSASAAAQSAASIEGDVQTATQKATEAQTAAGQAVTAQTAAETAATNAGQSASTATAKAAEAAQSASSAAQSKTDAEAAATRAETAAASLTVDSALSETSENPVQNKVITAEFTDVKSALSHVYYIVHLTDNLADPSKNTVGSISSDGTVNTAATAYWVSDYIPLDANTDYVFSNWFDARARTSRKYVALYDASKTFISGSYQNVNGVYIATFNSGAAKYARVSCDSTTDMYLCKGTTVPSAFAAYEIEYYTDMTVENYKDGTIPYDAFDQDVKNTIVNADDINLYYAQAAVVGVLQSNGHLNPTGTNYLTSVYIPIKQGFTYTISPKCRWKCFYSGESEAEFVSQDSTEYIAPHSFVAEITGFLRFSVINTASNVACVETYVGDATKKIEEGISLSEYQKDQVSALIEDTANLGHDVLYGKKWAVCGDSFTNSGGTGTVMPAGTKYAGNPYTYPWIIGSRQNMNIIKFFDGGRTLAFPEEPGTFVNSLTNPNATWYYQNIPADVDYITIYLGINDEHHSSASSGGDGEDNTRIIPIGTIDDNTTATYLGAWNVVLTWLITNRPNAHIGIIVTNGIANKDQYRQGQIAIAEKYGIPYIDMNGDARTPAMLRTSNPNISTSIKQVLIEKWSANYPSNQHPNDAAQLFESSFIENFLRSI